VQDRCVAGTAVSLVVTLYIVRALLRCSAGLAPCG
jgi:hypothetical protein